MSLRFTALHVMDINMQALTNVVFVCFLPDSEVLRVVGLELVERGVPEGLFHPWVSAHLVQSADVAHAGHCRRTAWLRVLQLLTVLGHQVAFHSHVGVAQRHAF